MIDIAEVGISSSHTLNRIDRKLTHKVLEADLLKHLVAKSVEGSVLVGLRHLRVSIRALYSAVGRKEFHLDLGISRSIGYNFVCFMYLLDLIPIFIGIYKEFMPSSSAFRRLRRPEGRGHTSEVGKFCGRGIHRDTVSLDNAGGKVIVWTYKSN